MNEIAEQCPYCVYKFSLPHQFRMHLESHEREGGEVSEGVPVSATDNYTPTTAEIEHIYVRALGGIAEGTTARAEVRRWLAAERAKAWDEGREAESEAQFKDAGYGNVQHPANPYREVQ